MERWEPVRRISSDEPLRIPEDHNRRSGGGGGGVGDAEMWGWLIALIAIVGLFMALAWLVKQIAQLIKRGIIYLREQRAQRAIEAAPAVEASALEPSRAVPAPVRPTPAPMPRKRYYLIEADEDPRVEARLRAEAEAEWEKKLTERRSARRIG